MLAYHYTEAGETTKAVDYWLKAAESASDRSANVEAVNHLKMGLGLVEALPEGPERKILELKLRIPLGAALITLKGAGSTEVEQVYARALELCAELPESPLHFAALWGWWRLSMNFQTGHERADKLFVLARNLGDPGLLMQAHHCLWATMFMLGNQSGCYRHIVEGLELYDEERHRAHASVYGGHDARVCGHGEAGLALWLLGFPDQALARIRMAEDSARALSHAGSMAHAMDIRVMLHHYLREGDKVRRIAEALVAFGEEKGFPDYVAKGIFFGGWALITRNRADAGLADLLKGIEMQRAIGTKEDFPVYYDMLAEAYRLGGQGEQALAQLDEGFAVADESGIHYWDAELHRQKGAVLCSLEVDRELEAEACYREAIAIAGRQKAKSLELRAVLSLARLWQAQGKTREAHEALSSVYGWFTEGFETIDLVEARAMLASLS
jgi:predicted ATPase